MKVRILRNTVAARRSVFEGEIVELSEQEAQGLILMRKAEAYVEPARNVEQAAPVVTEATLPNVERETAVFKRGATRKEKRS